MATRTVSDRIPSNPRSRAEAELANLPKWMQKKIGDMKGATRRAADARVAMQSLLAARDSGLPQAEALAKKLLANKEFMAAFNKLLAESGLDIESAEPTSANGLSAARNESAGSEAERDEINQRIAKEEGLTGADSARTFDAKVRSATSDGSINPARVAAGLPDAVATADDLFALGREAVEARAAWLSERPP